MVMSLFACTPFPLCHFLSLILGTLLPLTVVTSFLNGPLTSVFVLLDFTVAFELYKLMLSKFITTSLSYDCGSWRSRLYLCDFFGSYLADYKLVLTRAALEKMSTKDLISLFIENSDRLTLSNLVIACPLRAITKLL